MRHGIPAISVARKFKLNGFRNIPVVRFPKVLIGKRALKFPRVLSNRRRFVVFFKFHNSSLLEQFPTKPVFKMHQIEFRLEYMLLCIRTAPRIVFPRWNAVSKFSSNFRLCKPLFRCHVNCPRLFTAADPLHKVTGRYCKGDAFLFLQEPIPYSRTSGTFLPQCGESETREWKEGRWSGITRGFSHATSPAWISNWSLVRAL